MAETPSEPWRERVAQADYQALFEVVLREARDAILVTAAPEWRIVALSDSFVDLSGYRRGDLLGHRLRELDLVDPAVLRRATGGAGDGFRPTPQTQLRRRDGTFVAVAYSTTAVAGGELRLTVMRGMRTGEDDLERLSELAHRDHLTGLWNRRRFEEEVAVRVAEARRHGDGIAFVLMDLDRFKLINDRHGHPVGDRVLQRVADILRATVRATDSAARLGGDEFAILIPRASPEAGERAATDFADRLRRGAVAHRGGEITVSASIGVVYVEGGATGFAELYAAADAALYRNKRH